MRRSTLASPKLLALAALAGVWSFVAPAHATEPAAELSSSPPVGPVPAVKPCEGSDVDGCFFDIDDTWKDPSVEYGLRLDAMDPFHLMTIIGEVLFLGTGIVWYAIDDERNLADWDYPSWEQRFTLEAWRFDNNHFPINFAGHVLSGAAYYTFPRSNDHGVLVSAGYSFMTSFVWEFLVEFREKVSINDLPITTGAGLPIGEFAHKLFRYFNGIPPDASTGQHVIAATLGFPIYTRRAIAGNPQTTAGPYDDRGFSNHIRPDIRAGYQLQVHDHGLDRVATHGVKLGGRITSVPGEGYPGDFALFFYQADIVELWLQAGFGPRARAWELTADTHLLGLYAQDLDAKRDGYQAVVAMPLSYRYRFDDFYGYNDRIGVLHIPGIGGDFSYRAGDAKISAHHRFHADFGGLHSEAYAAWAGDVIGAGDREKTILKKHNYYYAFGLSSRFGGKLELGPFDIGATAGIGVYDSIEGLDRQQEDLTVDPDATDRILEIDTQLGFTVPETKLRLGGGWAVTSRRSRVEHRIVDRDLKTWSLNVTMGL